ncbi:PD-(D/E)XK nuclease domain-containing protein [Wolbachia endosymbiont of Ctenocephalides felis wCfeT]|uniref:PD-(D/E)XK nuclease domain-containing protein n=1 Tax=Wolbachia endosymbiont of Ctenocephalides felis wCfeT TaxID=2732593 RepID=UPI001444EA56|nr:PD-(D/E)XK nuclease domain-containing protein [Wolbachia endosymbiont of Ctenocephalides felis wCfeT]
MVKIFINKSNGQEAIHLNIRIGNKNECESIFRSVRIENNEKFLAEASELKFQVLRQEKIASLIIGYEEREYDESSSEIVLELEPNQRLQLANFNLSNKNKEDVQKLIAGVFRNLAGIFNNNEYKKVLQLQEVKEALHQVLAYGFFKTNTNIQCLIEFNAGLGIADLILKVNDVLIIVECKAGNKTAKDAIEQIKSKGYYYLDILGKFESTYLVGINFNQEKGKDLIVEEQEIFRHRGLINALIDYKSEGEVQEELKFLCHTKNIGICNSDNPSNHNEGDPKSKYAGSFTALVLGQVLQCCGQNDEYKLEHIATQLEEKNKVRNTDFVIVDGDNKLKLRIIELTDKGGNESPKLPATDEYVSSPECEDDDCSNYNIKVYITRNKKEFLYKIIFLDGKVTVKKEEEYTIPSTRARSDREVKSNKDDDYIYYSSSSQESGASPKKPPLNQIYEVHMEDLINEVSSGKTGYLENVVASYRNFIHSEANLQLFLKGLFMNAEINDDEQIVADIVVTSGQAGEIDLLMKLNQVMVFECKFCEKAEKIEDCKEDARSQLKSYIDKGNLKYIFGENSQLHTFAVVFCKESAICTVEVGIAQKSLSYLDMLHDRSNSSDSGVFSETSLTPSTSLLSLSVDITSPSSTEPSPGTKRKVMSPVVSIQGYGLRSNSQ